MYLAYRAHKDAVRRGLRYPEFWLVFVLLLNVVGYIVYLFVRNNYTLSPELPKPARWSEPFF
jgi:hypothetical protein